MPGSMSARPRGLTDERRRGRIRPCRHDPGRTFASDETASMPLALLVAIVAVGLATVLLSRILGGEESVRFDRAFTENLHAAEAGVDEALFRLNVDYAPLTAPGVGLDVGDTSPVFSDTVDGITYEWSATRASHRSWEITSTADVAGTARTLVATIEERSRFFPGAFGDQLIALNGASTEVDSYNSDPACGTGPDCGWGDDPDYGTGNGSLGTNGTFDWAGNTSIRPGGGFLYDWAENPGTGVSAGDVFGDRCNGNRCTEQYVSTVDEPLEFDSPERMEFITSKFDGGGACADVTGNPRYEWGAEPKLGGKGKKGIDVGALQPYATATGASDAADPSFSNFYCAESLEFLADIELDNSATPDDPVVFFVKDFVKIPNSGTLVACHDDDASTSCDKNSPRNITPQAARLQIYVAGEPSGSGGSGNVLFKSQSMFSGVLYAPLSTCQGTGGGVDVYGLMVCGSLDNVGNWDFHFDDDLGRYGTGEFDVANWREESPQAPPTP